MEAQWVKPLAANLAVLGLMLGADIFTTNNGVPLHTASLITLLFWDDWNTVYKGTKVTSHTFILKSILIRIFTVCYQFYFTPHDRTNGLVQICR